MFHVYMETRDGKRNRRARPRWANGGVFRKERSAKRYAKFLRSAGRNAWVEDAGDVEADHKLLVKKRDLTGWREVSVWGKKRFRKAEAYKARTKLRKSGREVKIQRIPNQRSEENRLIEKQLTGDLDFNHDLQVALAKVSRDIGVPLHVNYGARTYAEQAALYKKYGPGRAARPGTSDHETGNAADVVRKDNRAVNLRDIPGAVEACKEHGVVFPYGHEPWHAELG